MARLEYEVRIEGADNGIVVGVGCKRLVFTDGNIDEFLDDLKTYLKGGYRGFRKMNDKYFPCEEKNVVDPVEGRVRCNCHDTAAREEVPAPVALRA